MEIVIKLLEKEISHNKVYIKHLNPDKKSLSLYLETIKQCQKAIKIIEKWEN